MLSGKKPNCIKCGWVPILPENYEVMEILLKYSSVMVDGMGAVNIQAVNQVLEWEGIEPKESIIQKILVYIFVSLRKRSEDIRDGT